MSNKAPKLKLIQGGKKDPKIKLSLGLFLVFGLVLTGILLAIFGV